MDQAAGNARIDVQAALRRSRAARLRRRIAWCDVQLRVLAECDDLTEAEARRGLQLIAQRAAMREHLIRTEAA